MSPSTVLGVDFGTSHTVAVLHRPGHVPEPLLFDGSPLLSSAVYAEPDGTLLVGRDAVHSARLRPERFEPNPKRRVDDGTVLLADTEVPVVELFAAVLGRVRGEAERVAGAGAFRTVVTHPAVWGPARRLVLTDACASAGLAAATVVAEPVAAARYFGRRPGVDLAEGNAVVVYDFGGGTFDASVVAATAEGFEVLAVDGLDTLGGVDIDHALVQHIGRRFRDDDRWAELLAPGDAGGRRQHRAFMDDVRGAKERLSRQSKVELLVPLLEVDTHVTREELEAICEPLLGKAVRITEAVMRAAAVPGERIAGVFLVGGASRMPLAATSLHRGVGIAPTVIDQPELVVATGATIEAAPAVVTPPRAAEPVTPPPVPVRPPLAVTPPAPASVPPQASPVTPPRPRPARPPYPPPVAAAPAGPPPGTARPIALKVLLWVQFALAAGMGVFTVVILFVEPPPTAFIWIAAIVLGLSPFAIAAFTASNAVRLDREPVRTRRAVTVLQTTVLVHIGLGICFVVFTGVPGPPLIRLVFAVILVNAGVILGLARTPVLLAAGTGARDLRSQLKVQFGLMVPVAVVAVWWWISVAGYEDAYIAVEKWPGFPVMTGAMTVILLGVLVMLAVDIARHRADGLSVRSGSVLGEWLWLGLVALYALPWLEEYENRLMPTAYDIPAWDAGVGFGWTLEGDLDVFNELALWAMTASSIPAILVVVRFVRTAGRPR